MIKIEFTTDGAAFGNNDDGAEIARILRKLATSFAEGGMTTNYGHTTTRSIMDINGNKVGECKYTFDYEE